MSRLDDIFDDYKEHAGWARSLSSNPKNNRDEEWLKSKLKSLMLELVGDGEVHVSHVCPQDSIPCREFHARGALRNETRKKVNEL